jgi:hypothetical protein
METKFFHEYLNLYRSAHVFGIECYLFERLVLSISLCVGQLYVAILE